MTREWKQREQMWEEPANSREWEKYEVELRELQAAEAAEWTEVKSKKTRMWETKQQQEEESARGQANTMRTARWNLPSSNKWTMGGNRIGS
jgi:hypothetical protein